MNVLPKEFYQKDTVMVAKNLLGKKLVRRIGDLQMSGIIVETEAYRHKDDPASHAFRNITPRNKIMFGDVGLAYVYFTYGMHYCFNVVAKNSKTDAGAVLIRAIKPDKGITRMQGKQTHERFEESCKRTWKTDTGIGDYKGALWNGFNKKIRNIHRGYGKRCKNFQIPQSRNKNGN